MAPHSLIGLASILILGVGAQWLAWRLKFPSILLLLVIGFIAGPVTGFLNPDNLLGDLLLPVVSMSVAVILFEGGLSLRITELREIGKVLRNLITIGVMVTWVASAALLHFMLHLSLELSILLGGIFVVTGPTVIGPLLRHVSPRGKVGKIVKWEGIMNDPVGALLAVLVFEAILAATVQEAGFLVVFGILKTIFFGGLTGTLGAWLLVYLFKRHWIPDFLQESVTLMLVILVFIASNLLQAESGLFTVTLMGIVFANQRKVTVKHILDFKENLRVLIISSLFIILAARLQPASLALLDLHSFGFIAVLILVVRPVSVMLSTLGSDLNWRERFFVSWMAPRGIVAAAISSIFALELTQAGYSQAEAMVPLTFLVIVSTVTVYGLTALPVANLLRIADSNPQGVLMIGAQSWVREIAKALESENIRVLLVDTERSNQYKARMDGLATFHGSILSDNIMEEIDLGGIGKVLALTSNDEVNSLAALHISDIFSRSDIFQLAPESEENGDAEARWPRHLRGRFLFGQGLTHSNLSALFAAGAVIKTTKLTKEFDYNAYEAQYRNNSAIPLFLVSEGELLIFTNYDTFSPEPGQTVISLVQPDKTHEN